jgi:uncharacterized protein (TIGR02271 family)
VAKAVEVCGEGGWRGIVHHWGEDEITIRLDSGETIVVPDGAVTGRPDGTCWVAIRLDRVREIPNHSGDREPVIIPVIHEELEVGKRRVETGAGVRVRKETREEEQIVDLPLVHEQVEVRRVPVDRVVDGPVPIRHTDDAIIVPVMQEVLVVQKQLRVVEELHILKTRTERHDPQTVKLRREEATVERLEESQEGGR